MDIDFIFFDEPDAAVPEEVLEVTEIPEEPIEITTNYSELLYEHIVNRDIQHELIQEEINAAYMEKLESINSNLEWCVAFLVLIVSLILFSRVRGWVTMLTGGLKDVH